MRDIVTQADGQGRRLRPPGRADGRALPAFCRPCDATHLYEMPFRLAALRAGLELQPGTSPPVLQRIPGSRRRPPRATGSTSIRAYLRLLGPATPKHVADYLDAPVKDVKARWPDDVVEVTVDGRGALAAGADDDGAGLGASPVDPPARTVRPVPAGQGPRPWCRTRPSQGVVAGAGPSRAVLADGEWSAPGGRASPARSSRSPSGRGEAVRHAQ